MIVQVSRQIFALLLVAAPLSLLAPADGAQYQHMAPVPSYLMSDRQAEIDLARTAAPPSVSADADVLALGSHGYETAVKGTNGFVCLVERSWASPFNDPEFWNPKERSPNCFNPPAARTELPRLLKQTQWALSGFTLQQIIEKTKVAVADHSFGPPETGAFSFMLSKKGYLSDAAGGPWYPHVMFFVQRDQVDSWAPNRAGSPVLSQDRGEFESALIFIPVRRWSDGSPAVPVAQVNS
ncbi:MAG: hypothetical protein WCC84_02915 [Candidatus Cybelea sp.]